MKMYQARKAFIPMINKTDNTLELREFRAIGTDKTIKDKTGKEYQIFFQEKLSYFRDLRINNPKIGVIMPDKTFMAIGTYESYRTKFNSLNYKFGSIDALEMFNQHKSKLNNLEA